MAKLCAFLTCLFLLSVSLPVSAATITVTEKIDDDPTVDNGACSLREAVITANTDTQVDSCVRDGISVMDVIVFDPATDRDFSVASSNSVELNLVGANEDAAMTGDLDITDNLRIVGNYSLEETAAQNKATQVYALNSDRVFHVLPNVNFGIRNLLIGGGGGVTIGAGIFAAAGSSVGLDNCVVFDNDTTGGNAPNIGGGIFALGSLNLADSVVYGNRASAFGSEMASGGGVAAGGELVLNRVFVANNLLFSDDGDARGANIFYADLTGSGLTISDSHITQGRTRITGAGSALGLGLYHGVGQATVSGSTFSQHQVNTSNPNFLPDDAMGGAIYMLDPMTLTNTTVSDNSLDSDAGGIVDGAGIFIGEADAELNLNNVTVFENNAFNSPDIGFAGGLSNNFSATVNMSNSIIAGNNANSASPDCRGTITSAGYNLLSDDSDCSFMAATGDQVGTSGAPIDPVLDALEFDPDTTIEHPPSSLTLGFIAYHPLLDGSTAIDAADPMDPSMGGSCEATDARGETRPQDGDGDSVALCDMGAYEVSPVSSGGGSGGGSSGGGCSLGEGKARLDPVLSLLVLLAVGWLVVGWLISRRTRRSRPWK